MASAAAVVRVEEGWAARATLEEVVEDAVFAVAALMATAFVADANDSTVFICSSNFFAPISPGYHRSASVRGPLWIMTGAKGASGRVEKEKTLLAQDWLFLPTAVTRKE